jgi:hypothetical protein
VVVFFKTIRSKLELSGADRRRYVMSYDSDRLRNSTLALTLVIMGFLAISSLGAVIDVPQLAYFWYLALLGILGMMVMTVLIAVSRFTAFLTKGYREMLLHWGDGVAGH